MFRSIRFTLTLWYMSVFSLVLGFLGLSFYRNVGASLAQDIDKGLMLQVNGTAQAINAFWEAERTANVVTVGNWAGAPLKSLREEIDTGRFPEFIDRWVKSTEYLETDQPVRILDATGRRLAGSRGTHWVSESSVQEAFKASLREGVVYRTLQTPQGDIRLLTFPVIEDGQALYGVQAMTPLAQAQALLHRIKNGLAGLIPFAVLLTSIGGWVLTGRALKPIGEIIRQARRLGAERLDLRVPVPKTGDELEHLASAFNEMLARLERAFQHLRQFSAAASHELRTPLTVMKGELEVALRRNRSEAEYAEILQRHLETVEEMTITVEELLMLARTEAVKGAVDLQPVDLGGWIVRMVETWRDIAKSKGVAILARTTDAVCVLGEKRLLGRMLANLLDNAVRHTPAGGTITVDVTRRGDDACLGVRDTGTGIPKEDMPHIFERFFRPGTGHRTGIGLGLCRWIVEAHGGTIEVVSVPGTGTLFTVKLPLHNGTVTASPSPT